ncbi:MAG: hypothetical protein VB089_00005 [Anaerolineaceae bacterium]|nr:hypothetical protein [Anaerolineaceae bacterium]
MKPSRLACAILVLLILTNLPYLIALLMSGDGYVFSGFLINPLDGNSYLAKMYQGWEGSWRFHLPYTAEDSSPGGYLFLFYLFLGHVGRFLNLPLIEVYHGARILAGIGLWLALARFIQAYIPQADLQWKAFWLAATGSGLGWVAVLAGQFTSDFWVAEAYPFLSCYTNPHFPLALALILLLMVPGRQVPRGARLLIDLAMALCLAILLPFGFVIVMMLLTLRAALQYLHHVPVDWGRFLATGIGGGGMALYQLWLVQSDPMLRAWNLQNQTGSPPLWDFLISFSPVLVIAILGYVKEKDAWRETNTALLAGWLLGAAILIYLPVNLQRRFLLGYYLPAAVAAILFLGNWWSGKQLQRAWLAVWIPSLLTNLVLRGASRGGIAGHDPLLYLTQGESEAMEWIEDSTPQDALVLAAPQTGMWLPAWTGRRVIYGHPFETIHAAAEQATLEAFFSNWDYNQQVAFLHARQVQYLYIGPREKALGAVENDQYTVAYQNKEVTVYLIDH